MSNLEIHPPHFTPLPLGSIRPQGWLAGQLRLQADSLSGHLDEVWPDIRDSRWFGGDAEGWERAPYWLDGLIPLAYSLDDPALKAKACHYMDYILAHQNSDGWLGPREMVQAGGKPVEFRYNLWGQLQILKVLAQWHDATRDDQVLNAMEACLRRIDLHIDRAPLFNWGQFRWFEGLVGLYWLFERRPAQWLLKLAVKLAAQGFHWGEFFHRWPLTEPTPRGRWNYAGHVVNNAMAVKAHALWWRLTQSPADREAVENMMVQLDVHHGMVTGMFSGDECLAGKRPTQGSELCAVVEYAYSLETLLSIFGDPFYGDRLEKVIFNALPATFSPDMWSHQYDQQVNQVECSVRGDRPWTTNGPELNIFGLEPNYGCCTANLSQGWPKFAASLWMRTADDGLAAVAYAPSQVEFEIQGVPVKATLQTDYPFHCRLNFTVAVERPVSFPLLLRVPDWCQGASLHIENETVEFPHACTFHAIQREWSGTTSFVLELPARPELYPGCDGAVALARGPLVYALPVGEEWRRIHADQPGRELPHADWEVHPTTPWNYALALSAATLEEDVSFERRELGPLPFSPQGAPLAVHVRGSRLPGWEMENGSVSDAPPAPAAGGQLLEDLVLIPYGCTNLRVTEFPLLRPPSLV